MYEMNENFTLAIVMSSMLSVNMVMNLCMLTLLHLLLFDNEIFLKMYFFDKVMYRITKEESTLFLYFQEIAIIYKLTYIKYI